MPSPVLPADLTAFFDAFVVAFRTFDGERIAQRYLAPYVACQRGPALQSFATREDIARYFQTVVDAYHAKGVRACRYKDLQGMALGNESAIGTVTWELLAADEATILGVWTESYNLCRVDGQLKVFASVDHVL